MADRYKAGYMNYDEIADRLQQGNLNAYDVVYTKDTEEVIFIRPDGTYIRTKSRIDIYNTVVEAEAQLNSKADTYDGQIVGVINGNNIKHYAVNYADADHRFFLRQLGAEEYSQLLNLPTINGTPLVDNYDETDPTVPSWAKTPHKPEYQAYEVGAVAADDEMSFEEIDRLFNTVFGS